MKKIVIQAGEIVQVVLEGQRRVVDYVIKSSKKKCSAQMMKLEKEVVIQK